MREPLPPVSKSLLTPAYARAYQKLDPASIKVYDWIQKHWKVRGKIGEERIHIVMCRTYSFDDEVKSYIKKFPHARIINLGCGFCTRYYRVDNGHITWLDIDLKSVIRSRDLIFADEDVNENYRMAIQDIGELDEIPACDLVIAEGVLPYFPQEQVAEWIKKSSAHWIFDVIWNWKNLNTSFKWQYIEEEWDFTVLGEWTLDDNGRGYKVLHVIP